MSLYWNNGLIYDSAYPNIINGMTPEQFQQFENNNGPWDPAGTGERLPAPPSQFASLSPSQQNDVAVLSQQRGLGGAEGALLSLAAMDGISPQEINALRMSPGGAQLDWSKLTPADFEQMRKQIAQNKINSSFAGSELPAFRNTIGIASLIGGAMATLGGQLAGQVGAEAGGAAAGGGIAGSSAPIYAGGEIVGGTIPGLGYVAPTGAAGFSAAAPSLGGFSALEGLGAAGAAGGAGALDFVGGYNIPGLGYVSNVGDAGILEALGQAGPEWTSYTNALNNPATFSNPGFNPFDLSTYYGGTGASGFSLPNIPGLSNLTPQQVAQGASALGRGIGGGTGGILSGIPGIATGLYDLLNSNRSGVDPAKLNYLWQAGVDTYNLSRDPQSQLYDRTAGQIQDQTRAAQSARGLAMSPYGAAGEADTLKNFNIDWQNNLLNRQLAGLSGLANASGGYFRQANQNQQNQQARQQSGTNALLTGIGQASQPGGFLYPLANGISSGISNFFGGSPASFATGATSSSAPTTGFDFFNASGYNPVDLSTYFGGSGY